MANRIPQLLAAAESLTRVDRPAEVLRQWYRRVLPQGSTRTALTGKQVGHPLHPVLVLAPIGSWVSAAVLDVLPGQQDAARRLVGVGVVAAVPAVVTGAVDYQELTTVPQRRVGFVHAVSNATAMLCFAASYRARHSGHGGAGRLWTLLGLGAVGTGGLLGGHLTYAQGAGVYRWQPERAEAERTEAGEPEGADQSPQPEVEGAKGEHVGAHRRERAGAPGG